MRGEMRVAAPADRGDDEEADEAQRPEPSRDRRGKRQEPHRIHRQVKGVAMEERVGDEGPDRGADAARNDGVGEDGGIIARRE